MNAAIHHPAFAAQIARTAPQRPAPPKQTLRTLLLTAARASDACTSAASPRTPEVGDREWNRLAAAQHDARQALLDYLLFEEGIRTAEAELFGRVL